MRPTNDWGTPGGPLVPPSHRDPDRALVTLARQRISLDLSSLDLCFAAALYLRAEGAGLTSFDEERLIDVFEEVAELVEPGSDSVRVRATHAIRRLREQRLLARVDGAGVVRAGEFALSRLGASIVEFYLEEDFLTRESLTLLLHTLASNLDAVLKAAQSAHATGNFNETVVGPLRITIGDLTDGIERRQRGLDHQQEEFQREMGRLLEADWFAAIDRCQSLLESTACTLRELNSILLKDSPELLSRLHDIVELALDAGDAEAEAIGSRLIDQIDRITAWGAARQQAWSEYYDYVHRYLRDVVRLDPTRALTQRLREQLAGFAARPFSLVTASAEPMRVLREVTLVGGGPPVRRQRKEREPEPTPATAEDPLAPIEARVREELARGALDLASLTAAIAAETEGSERFLVAGRVAEIVAKVARPLVTAERPWVPVADQLCIEQWHVARNRGG